MPRREGLVIFSMVSLSDWGDSRSDCEIAIDNIVNESIVQDGTNPPVNIVLDQTDLTESIKKTVREEFTRVLDLLNFNNFGHDIFRRWYVEGRIYYHIMIDENNPQLGIVELRSLDATKIKKVKQVKQEKKGNKKVEVHIQPLYNYNEAGLDLKKLNGYLILP